MFFCECLDFHSGFDSMVLAATLASKVIIVKNGFFQKALCLNLKEKEDLQLLLVLCVYSHGHAFLIS